MESVKQARSQMPKRSEGLQAVAETVLVETGAIRRRTPYSAEFVNRWDYKAVEKAHHQMACMRKAGQINGTLEEIKETIWAVMQNASE